MSGTVQRIGVFGGTFNPIHNGHLAIARCALDQFDLTSVLFVPTGHTAYKPYMGSDMNLHRCRMVELAIEEEPRFALSLEEISCESVSYTYLTLATIQESNPDAQLFFLMGGDSLRDFSIWRYPEIICREADILVAVRADEEDGPCGETLLAEQTRRLIGETKTRYHGTFYLLNTPPIDLSSSEIRRRISKQEEFRSMVPPAVADYIEANGLYRENA